MVRTDGTALGELAVAETRFVGREPQLGILKSRWAQSLEGMGQVVLLIGDEGSGKSRLLSEFIRSISGNAKKMQQLSVNCRPAIRGVSYGCISEAFRSSSMQLAVIDNGHVVEGSARDGSESEAAGDETALEYLVGSGDDEESMFSASGKAQFAEAVLNRLQSMARSAPVLFSVEDIQWADAATLSLLQDIAVLGPNDRILTVLTCRGDFETPWGSHPNQSQIALRALSQQHIRDILSTGIDHDLLSDEYVRRVRKCTKGLPSLIEGVRDGIIPVGQ
jgi:predicted ATPase